MQIKLSYAEAQKLIIDVADKLITQTEDVVIALPDAWTTTPPTAEGTYWAWGPHTRKPILIELTKRHDQLYEIMTGMYVEDIKSTTHWLGPLPEPKPPVVEVDEPMSAVEVSPIDPDTGLPPGAIEMTEPKDDD